MGSATMRFGEGIIVSGTVAGSDPIHALHVSGNVRVRGDVQMGANDRIYFDGHGPSITNGPYIYGNTTSLFIDSDNRMTLSFDKDLRILDNSNSTVMHITDKAATDSSIYKIHDDTHFFVSGAINSIDGDVFGASVYGGDLVVSGVIQGKNSSLGMGTHDLHIGSKDNFLAFGSSFQFNQNNDNIDSPGDDVFLFMSGAIGGAGLGGVALFGGDVVISGSLFAGNSNNASQNLVVNSNISGDFAAVIDNDNSNQGHGLKVTSDGTGTGTNVFEVESVSNTLLRVRGDGRVGIGVTSPSSLLHVNGSTTINTNLHVSGSTSIQDYMIISVSADNTDLQTGTGLVTFRAPFAMTLYQIPRASLSTNGTGQTTVDINVGGTTIMNTNKLTIDANEGTSVSAATTAALTTTNITDDQQITIDVDQAGAGARGLKVTLYYRRNF